MRGVDCFFFLWNQNTINEISEMPVRSANTSTFSITLHFLKNYKLLITSLKKKKKRRERAINCRGLSFKRVSRSLTYLHVSHSTVCEGD